MTSDQFKEFCYRRPAIDLKIFAKEASMSKSTLDNFIKGKTKPTKRTLDKIERVAARYGLYWPNATPNTQGRVN